MTRNSEQFRAVFLAALMVLSVFAGTIAFTGTAAAEATNIDLGNGNGNQVSVEAGSSAEIDATVTLNDDGAAGFNSTTVWVDEDSDGKLSDGEPNKTVSTSSSPKTVSNIDISGLSAGTYDVSAAETGSSPSAGTVADKNVTDQLKITSSAVPSLQSANHYDNDTSSNTDGEVELAFDEDIASVQKLNVSKEDGNTNLTSSVSIDNGRVVATLNDVYTEDLEVTYKVTDTSGNAHSEDQTADVTFAAVTIKETDSENVYKGSTVAVVANNTATDVEITGAADDNDFFRSGSTGTNSQVYVLDTEDREDGDYDIVFAGDESKNASITVRDLGLGVEIDDLSVTNADDSKIEGTVTANAGDRPVTIELLNSDEDVEKTIGADLTGQAEYEFEFNASDLDTGNYTVLATDNQSGVESESSSIVVSKAGEGKADIGGDSIITEQRGDVANVTVTLQNTDTATLTVGSADVGYRANVTVVDDSGDGQVSVLFNTYTATTGVSGDVFEVANSDDTIDSTDFDSQNTVSSLLDSGEYDIQVQSGTDANPDETQGVGTLVLEERATTAISSWTAPSGTDFADAGEVREEIASNNLTADDSLAFGDVAVHKLEASGLEGAIDAEDDVTSEFFALQTNDVISLSIEQTEAGANRDPYSLILGADNTTVIEDTENDTYYVYFDTNDVNTTARDLEADDGLTANFTVLADEGNLTTDDEQETVEDEYDLVEAEHTLEDPLNVSAMADQKVMGETTVAPGTELNLRVRSTGDTQPSFLKTSTVYVTENNTFSSMFDFSEQEAGDTYEITVRNGPADDQTAEGTVLAGDETETETVTETDNGNETATTTEEPTTETATATEEPTTETATATEETGGEDTETETGTPGFGAVVAVTALLAAALLAVRRD
ncbi:PGF-CTERM sorting domain-containing protein [Halogeometricum borinquense]|uniref:PGF-CTERM sorting domain-containing protein n=1 Tax=Halogeometricum borinquense TaxID=60847 RepID=A0A6C0UKL9_9EURY|nr:BGTF surface domain-containing protein [Halogeometricum borinquense]QIB73518.1 PGF-CTERM sorting domain-containing protein [Halogeometricum borinquense]